MRCVAVIGLSFLLAVPAFAVDEPAPVKLGPDKVNVEQLTQRISAEQRRSDKDLARILEGLELTERLSPAHRNQLVSLMRGERSRQAFTAVADLSEVLDPPPAEIPSDPAPSPDDQHAILTRAGDYAATSVEILPRFFATRETLRFQRDTPPHIVREPRPANAFIDLDTGTLHVLKPIAAQPPPIKPFRFLDSKRATVFYRGQQEVVDSGPAAPSKDAPEKGAETWGEFGPFLRLVVSDVLAAQPQWSHWEQGESARLAVFRFNVPRDKSHYTVSYCCVPFVGNLMMHPVHDVPAYDGEIAIEPATGAVMRLLLRTHPLYIPMERADIAVEYAFVNLGGKQYLCPRRSITITLAHPPKTEYPKPQSPDDPPDPEGRILSYEPQKTTTINDVRFDDFHMAVGEMRVVPEKPKVAPAETPAEPDKSEPDQPNPDQPKPEQAPKTDH